MSHTHFLRALLLALRFAINALNLSAAHAGQITPLNPQHTAGLQWGVPLSAAVKAVLAVPSNPWPMSGSDGPIPRLATSFLQAIAQEYTQYRSTTLVQREVEDVRNRLSLISGGVAAVCFTFFNAHGSLNTVAVSRDGAVVRLSFVTVAWVVVGRWVVACIAVSHSCFRIAVVSCRSSPALATPACVCGTWRAAVRWSVVRAAVPSHLLLAAVPAAQVQPLLLQRLVLLLLARRAVLLSPRRLVLPLLRVLLLAPVLALVQQPLQAAWQRLLVPLLVVLQVQVPAPAAEPLLELPGRVQTLAPVEARAGPLQTARCATC